MRRLDQLVEDLCAEETLAAVVRDGWPAPMVRAGFELHHQTWDADGLRRAIEAELEVLDDPAVPETLLHVWPSLPGAGVTTVLLAGLLGVRTQLIRPSGRGAHFAQRFREISGIELVDDLVDAQRYVVSGSDSTIGHIAERVGAPRVVGYGSRQSFAVIVDDGSPERHIEALATDIVMWLGRGCFSAHAVLFVGEEDRARLFGADLAAAIAEREVELVPEPDEGLLARRAQALGLAQFQTDVWPARIGWVELRPSWDGTEREANVVALCCCQDPEDVLAVAPRHLQGVAWGGPDSDRAHALGVTRICAPGELQAPPPNWAHDGVSNAAALLGLRSGRL